MKYTWSVNIYDSDGDEVEKCILVHTEDVAILKFKNIEDLESFAKEILRSLPEMKENYDV